MIKFKDILTEIGDNIQIPPGSSFELGETYGTVTFKFMGENYEVYNRIIMNHDDKIVVSIDFYAEGSVDMTNKNQAIKLMSYVTGSVNEWLKRYVSRYGPKELIYIKYDPKKEEDEIGNRRDTLYKYYISKFAKSLGSSVTFSELGGIISKFEPPIKITP